MNREATERGVAGDLVSGAEGVAAPPRAAGCAACAHCGEPAGPAAGEQPAFCCAGCRTAYEVIHACGLERYYRLRDEDPAGAKPAAGAGGAGAGRRYAEFDDPTFARLYVKEEGGLASAELFLQGVHCAACVWLVERVGRVAPGVVEARLDLRRAIVRVVWDPAATRLSAVARALDALGYPAHPARDGQARRLRRGEDRTHLIRIAVAGACAGNAMLLALALYAGLFDGMEAAYTELFRWTSMGVTLVSLLWPGMVFFRGAAAALRTRTMHLDVPIALGLFAGGVWSVVSTVRGAGEIYFDSLAVLVFALLVGRFIQHRQQRWASDALELLFSLTPTSARLVGPDGPREVAIEGIRPGDVVEVRAGESVPVDGEVIAGESAVDQALLTGEATPTRTRAGDSVAAGAVNLGATLTVRVQATGEATRVGRLMRLVEECAQRRAPIVALADRIAGGFTAGMLGLAGVTLGAWLLIEPGAAVERAAALLIVTCPCALGLATPLAMTVALGRAARSGMLIKGGGAAQALARPGVIYLDKTGTITAGKLAVVAWYGPERLKAPVAALEAESSHPIALALARDLGPAPAGMRAERVAQTLGGGIQGMVAGEVLLVGSGAFARSKGVDVPARLRLLEQQVAEEGHTPVVVAVDGQAEGVAALGDPIRPDAAEAIAALRGRGWRVAVLSGDHAAVVARVAARVGVEAGQARGGVSPEEKLRAVEEAKAGGATVVMVGDGVNDAAALAAADVGVAVHGGAEASLAAADVYLRSPGLEPIVRLVEGSARTMGVIRRNFAASLVYNALAAGLAVTGLINPLLAAVFMPVSSITVLVMSFKGRTFGGPR